MFKLFLNMKLKHNDMDIESTMKIHQNVLIKKNLSVNKQKKLPSIIYQNNSQPLVPITCLTC